MQLRFCLSLISLLFLVSACASDTTAPDNTTTTASAGTMIYTYNGTVINVPAKYKDQYGISHGAYAVYVTSTKQLSVLGNTETPSQMVGVNAVPITGPMEMDPTNGTGNVEFFRYPAVGNRVDFSADREHGGPIKITKLDLANKLVSGTFSVSVMEKYGTKEVVTLTNGSFTDVPIEVQ